MNEQTISYWSNATGPVDIPIDLLKTKFTAWLRRKDLAYLSFYKWVLPAQFIKEPTGLNGSVTDIELQNFENLLMDIADEYKKAVRLNKFRYILKR